MNLLEGKQIEIKTPALRELVGKKVTYLLKRNSYARGGVVNYHSKTGTILDVFRYHIDFGDGSIEHFNQISEIVIPK